MMKKWLHILILLPLLLATGCFPEPGPESASSGLMLTVRCEDPALTKSAPEDGEKRFNENLIKSVDFFFYPGDSPNPDADAVYHHRVDFEEDPVKHIGENWEATYNLVIARAKAEEIFTEENGMRATVYAVVNYNGELAPGGDLDGTSLSELAATAIDYDFADGENAYIQPNFLMDGQTVITFDESAAISASGTIDVRRFAAKITTAISVAKEVTLKHVNLENPPEVWTPVLHTMRIYLVDGAKNVTLGTVYSADNTSPAFFSYSAEEHKHPFVKDNGTTYLSTDPENPEPGNKVYYNTYPMYSYPVAWSTTGMPDYTQKSLPKQPYLKLEMDWRRVEDEVYSYDMRKYYYKVILPVDSLVRNNWYHLKIDVSILGSETDEGKAVIYPYCYILDWQNRSVPIDKYAVISKARYLSVDTTQVLNNLTKLSIPFLSSHDVKIVEGTAKARRPYYGESPVKDQYNTKYHAWVREDDDGTYYLEYNGQADAPEGQGLPGNEPFSWLTPKSTSIEFEHALQNNYTKDDFDYSPYTIEFDIVHNDLKVNVSPYNEYVKHITIIQYPGIFIESCMNSDTEIRATSDNNGNPYYHSLDDKDKPWLDYPWGYVYVDNDRFIRRGRNSSDEPYDKLSTEYNKKEYQWRTVWYTGGGRNIFRINVTVLPSNSEFVIGDPRIDGYDTTDPLLGYSFVNNGTAEGDAVLVNHTGNASNFTPAPVVDGDVTSTLTLTGETRPLMYYRPTEKSDRTINMIAPGYRISTKLGGTEFGNLDEAHAKWRCAGYQEDGFPGGRWRIPTLSEIKFIAQLSANGVFESMFKGDYWSANGVVNVNKEQGTVTPNDHTTALLRCVYDSWYWGDEQWYPRTEFVWGDRP